MAARTASLKSSAALVRARLQAALYHAWRQRLSRLAGPSLPPGGDTPLSGISLTALTDLEDFGLDQAPLPFSGGAAWGDSITLNNAAETMFTTDPRYSVWTAISYAPTPDTIPVGRWPAAASSYLATTLENKGAGGQTSAQISARIQADATLQGLPVLFAAGTNDSGNALAVFNSASGAISDAMAFGDPADWIVSTYGPRASLPATAYALQLYSEAQGGHSLDWWAEMLPVMHRIEANGDPGTKAGFVGTGTAQPGQVSAAFMSSPTPGGGLDVTHPGPLFSEAISKVAARAVSAVSGGPPFLHSQTMGVDWSASVGTKIADLRMIGAATNGTINYDGGYPGAVTYSNGALYRGPGTAPTGVAEIIVEVANDAGWAANRVMLYPMAGTTRFRPGGGRLLGVNTTTCTSAGTISIVWRQTVSASSRFLQMGDMQVQVRTTGDMWFNDSGMFSSNVIPAGTANVWQHFVCAWDATTAYTSINGVSTDRTSLFVPGGPNLAGAWQLLGSQVSLTVDSIDLEHLWVSPEYVANGADWSAIANNATGRSNMSASSYKITSQEPLLAIKGGPGAWAAPRNWGTLGLRYLPDWSAADAQIYPS